MKKSLFTLSAIALATSTASAYTLVDNKETGTKLDFSGSARIVWESKANKTKDLVENTTTKNHVNKAVRNNASRFGFQLKQDIAEGFYGLGRVEWRFRGTSSSQHDFDDIYTRQLYAGIGHKQYGEVVHGNMTVITDYVKQTDLPNTLSLSDGLLVSSARKVTQYTYKGIEGLTAGVYYGDKSKRNMNGLDLKDRRKDVWGVAAIYDEKLDDLQSVTVAAGFSRERTDRKNTNAYLVGSAYTYDKTTIGLDLARSVAKGLQGNKVTEYEVSTVLNQQLTDVWRAYGMYSYKQNKESKDNAKEKAHQYMVGTEYTFVPKHLKGFVEWQTSYANHYTNGAKTKRTRDNVTAIGLRAYW